MTEGKAPSVLEVQHQIRANASQLQDYFSDLYAWEKTIEKEDGARKRAAKTCVAATPPPRTAKFVKTDTSNNISSGGNTKSQDAHTYDKGYQRWEKFDVDAALKEVDEEAGVEKKSRKIVQSVSVPPVPRQLDNTSTTSAAPTSLKNREELEKEEGNAHYKRGDYVAAIKSYTRCLGFNPHNAVVLSNRAMAYLKNREFANAEDDCTLALKADAGHIKSFLRRGTARNSLGKHRLALVDFYRAANLDPKNRQIQAQLQSTRELIRTAIKRSPKRTEFSIEVVEKSSSSKHSGGADKSSRENNEDLGSSQQPEKSRPSTKQKVSPLGKSATASVSQNAMSLETRLEKSTTKSSPILPKLPKKAPATSYEFGRVWKTFALRGDADHKNRLLKLRADYLRLIDPPALRSVFKNGIESDMLCEMFYVLRHAVLTSLEVNFSPPRDSVSFVLAFIREMSKVPRFGMTIMLLSEREKEGMTWVVQQLEALIKEDNQFQDVNVAELRKLYGVQTNGKLMH